MKYLVEPIKNLRDVDLVADLLAKTSKRNYLIFVIGINTGLRISDILALDIGDVVGRNYVEIVERKTQKKKRFPLNEKLRILIRHYLNLEYGMDKPYSIDKGNPLFCGKKHKRLSRSSVYRFLKTTCRAVGITANIGTHTMRKTFGYFFYNKYKDLALLQKIFNHSSPAITMRYIGIDQEEIDTSYKNFEL